MSPLSRLFGRRSAAVDKTVRTTSFGATFIDIPSRAFYGQCSSSPNGRYTLAWRDGNDAGTQGGARASGKGRYLLLDSDVIIAEGRMERPNDGKVADNGTFVLNDWRFFTAELRGTFYAFRPGGSEILQRKFKANLFNNVLSRDGCYAVCQSCNSPYERDSSVLTVFDLEKPGEIAAWRPESGWANTYAFGDDGATVSLSYREGPPLRYTLVGEFLDRTLWVDSALDRGDLYMIDRVIKETHPRPQGAFARRLLASTDKALAAIRADDPRSRARAPKLKGICFDGLEDFPAALRCYEEGLALEPKLGVKRRIEQLRKKLTTQI
ncbi:MAG: hypothetical protein GC166_15155 [Alphaproteobacteria bacterium]|nr:hypothetical protein [Alphaproteobacteria bacterium]